MAAVRYIYKHIHQDLKMAALRMGLAATASFKVRKYPPFNDVQRYRSSRLKSSGEWWSLLDGECEDDKNILQRVKRGWLLGCQVPFIRGRQVTNGQQARSHPRMRDTSSEHIR
jgi:hypothetical protein